MARSRLSLAFAFFRVFGSASSDSGAFRLVRAARGTGLRGVGMAESPFIGRCGSSRAQPYGVCLSVLYRRDTKLSELARIGCGGGPCEPAEREGRSERATGTAVDHSRYPGHGIACRIQAGDWPPVLIEHTT